VVVSLIEEALAANELYVALQPIVDIARQKVFAHEALLRSNAPAFAGALPIIQEAVREGLMGMLGRRLRQMSVKACPATPLFLNVHPSEFDHGFLVRPDDPIFAHDHTVVLEITEAVPLSHFRLCHSVLAEIRSKGVLLAVDDLGAGYSNLKYIADLTPEYVKLDRQLIAGLVPESRTHTLIKHIVRLCAELGAGVIAEGVETREELESVAAAGIRMVQGYLLARPAYPAPLVNTSELQGIRLAAP
jgi:EAL domain-containing protein (putative c-di-GMP-specific phosphodiesterase class I)